MTVERLLCAFQNISPSRTKIVLQDCASKKVVWSGSAIWDSDALWKEYADLEVNDFCVDLLDDRGCVKTLTMFTKKVDV